MKRSSFLKFYLFSIAIIALLSCSTNENEKKNTATYEDHINKDSTIAITNDPWYKNRPGNYCTMPTSGKETDPMVKSIYGKLIPNLDDSTLLKFVYGSYRLKRERINERQTNDFFTFNRGAQILSEIDSTYMKVMTRLGNDTVQFVFLIGDMAVTSSNHNQFNLTGLVFKKISNGWMLMDAFIDITVTDLDSIFLKGSFNNNFLFSYHTTGVYDGGISFACTEYNFLKPYSFAGARVNLITGASNMDTPECMTGDKRSNVSCVCYHRTGQETFNRKLNCLEFHYKFENETIDCESKKSKKEIANQTWYMNTDTTFLANGSEIDTWGENIFGNIKLNERDIINRLEYKK
jgi:hypothetical protein